MRLRALEKLTWSLCKCQTENTTVHSRSARESGGNIPRLLAMYLPFYGIHAAMQVEREARSAAEARLATTKSALAAKAHLVSELRDEVCCCDLPYT